MYWFLETPSTMLLMILAIVITGLAQLMVSGAYKKYKRVTNKKGLTGREVAAEILKQNGMDDIYVVETKGYLSDHYDPRRKVVRLSSDIYGGTSIAAASVAAHEVGHAIQDKDGYFFMKIRSVIIPVVNIMDKLGYVAIFIGFLFGRPNVAWLGIILLLGTVAFQLVTLPVELNASSRAKKQLLKHHLIEEDEKGMVGSMLGAAAFTYVAGLITTLLQILRLVLIVQDRD